MQPLVGQRHHAEALRIQLIDHGFAFGIMLWGAFQYLALHFYFAADG